MTATGGFPRRPHRPLSRDGWRLARPASPARRALPAALLLLALVAPPAQARDFYSRNCPKLGHRGLLMPGTYDGDFDTRMSFKGDSKALGMGLALWFRGKLHLEVGGNGLAAEGTTAEAQYSLGGAGKKKVDTLGVIGGMSFSGTGTLALSGALESLFDVQGPLDLSGGIVAGVDDEKGAQDAQAEHPGQASGEVQVRFWVESASCFEAQGHFTAAFLDQTASAFAGKGFTVTPGQPRWRVTSTVDPKEIERFKQELVKPPPAGIVRTHDAELQRLVGLETKALGTPSPAGDCMLVMWRTHTSRRLHTWLEDDSRALERYKAGVPRRCDPSGPGGCAAGDTAGLMERIRVVIRTAQLIAQLGYDTCAESLHGLAWSAISSKLSQRLEYLVRVGAAPEDLVSFARTAEVLGAVEPGLMSDTMAEVGRQALAKAQALYVAYRQSRQAHGKDDCDPAVREAARLALTARHQCDVVHGRCERCMSIEEYMLTRDCRTGGK